MRPWKDVSAVGLKLRSSSSKVHTMKPVEADIKAEPTTGPILVNFNPMCESGSNVRNPTEPVPTSGTQQNRYQHQEPNRTGSNVRNPMELVPLSGTQWNRFQHEEHNRTGSNVRYPSEPGCWTQTGGLLLGSGFCSCVHYMLKVQVLMGSSRTEIQELDLDHPPVKAHQFD